MEAESPHVYHVRTRMCAYYRTHICVHITRLRTHEITDRSYPHPVSFAPHRREQRGASGPSERSIVTGRGIRIPHAQHASTHTASLVVSATGSDKCLCFRAVGISCDHPLKALFRLLLILLEGLNIHSRGTSEPLPPTTHPRGSHITVMMCMAARVLAGCFSEALWLAAREGAISFNPLESPVS